MDCDMMELISTDKGNQKQTVSSIAALFTTVFGKAGPNANTWHAIHVVRVQTQTIIPIRQTSQFSKLFKWILLLQKKSIQDKKMN